MTARHVSRACQTSLERLSRFLDGDLSAAARRQVEFHLRHCPCCRDVVSGLQRAVDLCHQAGQKRMPVVLRARARARVARLLAAAASRRHGDRA